MQPNIRYMIQLFVKQDDVNHSLYCNCLLEQGVIGTNLESVTVYQLKSLENNRATLKTPDSLHI